MIGHADQSSPSRRAAKTASGGHPWIYRADVGDVHAAGGDVVRRFAARAAGRSGHALLQRSLADRAAHADPRRASRPTTALIRRRIEAAIAFRGDARASTRRRTGSSTAKPICCRRSSSIATATTSSCRRCRRAGPAAAARLSRRCSELAAAARHPRAKRSADARLLEGLEQQVDVLRGRRAGRDRRDRERRATTTSTSGTARRPACFSISARTARPRRCTRAAALLDCFTLQRRLCAGARGAGATETIAIDVSEDAIARVARRTPRATASTIDARVGNVFDELRGLERLRRAVRHDRARSAGVREEQGRGRPSARPATRKSTCAR